MASSSSLYLPIFLDVFVSHFVIYLTKPWTCHTSTSLNDQGHIIEKDFQKIELTQEPLKPNCGGRIQTSVPAIQSFTFCQFLGFISVQYGALEVQPFSERENKWRRRHSGHYRIKHNTQQVRKTKPGDCQPTRQHFQSYAQTFVYFFSPPVLFFEYASNIFFFTQLHSPCVSARLHPTHRVNILPDYSTWGTMGYILVFIHFKLNQTFMPKI